MKPESYDQKQIGAVLTYCLVCHRHFYFTGPARTVCLRCQREAGKVRDAGATKVEGSQEESA